MCRSTIFFAAAMSLFMVPVFGDEPVNENPADARIVTEDIERFWKAWDKAAGMDDKNARARIFFEEYFLPATPGLRDFIYKRIFSVFHLLAKIDRMPKYYASLRKHMAGVGETAEPAREAFRKLEALYPAAVFPDVYIVIGRANSGGTTGPSGLLIGAEIFGGYPNTPTDELKDGLKKVIRPMEELPHIIAHELVHYQQEFPETATLLEQAFIEGSADFVAELISGRHINHHVHEWALPREREIWQRFSKVMNGTDLSGFLYNGKHAKGKPADVGYFIGYRIAQAYYEQADDKRQALANILTTTDVKALLKQSGYASRFAE